MGDALTGSDDRNTKRSPDFPEARSPLRLRVLVFTLVFPSRWLPLHGIFVLERIRHLAALADILVVAPVPWYRASWRQASACRVISDLPVRHPRFWFFPKILKTFRGLFLFMSAVREVKRLRKAFDFDLIDAHFAYPDGFAAILLGWWFHRPVCITLRGTIIPISSRPVGRWLCNWAIRRAERVIAVAENLAERAREGGVPEHRIEIIANGVDSERFQLWDRSEARIRLGLQEHGRLLVSVGHLSPRKGFHRVIASLPRVIESCPDLRLAIIGGRGAERDNSLDLHALVERLSLRDRVLFVGAKPSDSVALWLGAADIFVLASDFEGCPNVILEAMACGRPIVATKVGDVERMVPTFAGILVDDPEDIAALAGCLLAALTRDWNNRRIREYVSTQSWDYVARGVAAQWLLAVKACGTQGARFSATSSQDADNDAAQSPKL
jgi:teichuronic acid biosynthesis glycosyltransferase TuaC